MSLTDPVADLLTRIRNSTHARHQKLDIPVSKLKLEIARILKEEGYIANFKPAEEEGRKVLRIYLKYGPDNSAAISNLQRVSRPGCRVYVGRKEIPRGGRRGRPANSRRSPPAVCGLAPRREPRARNPRNTNVSYRKKTDSAPCGS